MEEVLHKTAEPVKVKIEKGQRGGIGWEISVKGDDPDAIIQQVASIHLKLLEKYQKGEDNVTRDL